MKTLMRHRERQPNGGNGSPPAHALAFLALGAAPGRGAPARVEAAETAPGWVGNWLSWPVWRSWVLCLATANACLIRIWVDLLAHDPWPAHRNFTPPGPDHYVGACLLTLALGTAIWVVYRAARQRWLRLGLAAGCGLLFTKEAFLAITGFGWISRGTFLGWRGLVALGAIAVLAVGGARFVNLTSGAAVRRLATALLPLLALTFASSFWRMALAAPPSTHAFNQSAADRSGARLVWIILDEIDEEVAFTARPRGLRLPELDRFRSEAQWVARQAYSPANATAISIPALLKADGPPEQSFFGKAHRAGLRSGIVGWAVPYCEIFRQTVDACAWWPMAQQHNTYGAGFPAVPGRMAISLLESNQVSPFGQSLSVRAYVDTVNAMAAAANVMAARADLDVVYLHLSPPHNPYVYDPQTGRMDVVPRNLPNAPGYLRNLLLADRVFGGVRRSLERAGLWDRSIVVVTGDHGFRSKRLLGYPGSDRHVPFMVKTRTPLSLDPAERLETGAAGDLMLEWLQRARN